MWGNIAVAVIGLIGVALGTNLLATVETRQRRRIREETELLEHLPADLENVDEYRAFLVEQLDLYMQRSRGTDTQRWTPLAVTWGVGFPLLTIGFLILKMTGRWDEPGRPDLTDPVTMLSLSVVAAGYFFALSGILKGVRRLGALRRRILLRKIRPSEE